MVLAARMQTHDPCHMHCASHADRGAFYRTVLLVIAHIHGSHRSRHSYLSTTTRAMSRSTAPEHRPLGILSSCSSVGFERRGRGGRGGEGGC